MTPTNPLDAIAGGRATSPGKDISPKTTADTKDLIKRLYPNGGRCLLANVQWYIDFCHLLRRKLWKDDMMLTTLEWKWGLRRGSLNINTAYNMIILQPHLHRIFDAMEYILLADRATVTKFTADKKNRWPRFADFDPDKKWKYTVLPMSFFKHPVVLRLRGSVGGTIDPSRQSSPQDHEIWDLRGGTHHVFCHPHPLFVIMHAGAALIELQTLDPLTYRRYAADYPQIDDIVAAFTEWDTRLTQKQIKKGLKSDSSFAPVKTVKPISAASIPDPRDANDKDYSDSGPSQSDSDNSPTAPAITRSRASAYASESSQASTPAASTLSASIRASRSSQRPRDLSDSSAPVVANSDAYRPEGSSTSRANIKRKGSSATSSNKRKR